MTLAKMPATVRDWKTYSRTSKLRRTDPVLKQIDGLVDAYRAPEYNSAKIDLLFQLIMCTDFWLRKVNKDGRFKGDDNRRQYIQDMYNLCDRKLKKKLNRFAVDVNEIFEQPDNHSVMSADEAVAQRCLLTVKANVASTDRKAAERGMPYFKEESDRRKMKIHFRSGKAYCWSRVEEDLAEMVLYDTDSFNDRGYRKGENDVGIFVMGETGRIYVGFDRSTGYRGHVHSYFLGGAPVSCAGLMRVERGEVVTVSGSSGHYGPASQHMIRLLTRLKLYQVNMGKLSVRRVNEKVEGDIEECRATDYLRHRGWPTGVEPNKMWVK